VAGVWWGTFTCVGWQVTLCNPIGKREGGKEIRNERKKDGWMEGKTEGTKEGRNNE